MDKQLERDQLGNPDLEQIPMADEEGEDDTEEEEVPAPGAVGGLQDHEHRSLSPVRSSGEANIVGECNQILAWDILWEGPKKVP